MKHLLFYICLLLLCVSCIEEFNELPGDAGDPMLVVEGEIVSGKTCTFTLRRSATLEEIAQHHYQNSQNGVKGTVRLECSDGSCHESIQKRLGTCQLDVPELDPDKTYTLHVLTEELGDYHSEPMKPLYAPELQILSFDIPNNDGQVHFHISTADPNAKTFFKWDFEEYYEVYTPAYSDWEYDAESEEIYARGYPINHGWISVTNNQPVIDSNEEYGNHAVNYYTLFQRDSQKLRFRNKYMAIVKQSVISVEEYEYHRLSNLQSTSTGGIFGNMPSELPSNLKTDEGKRAIGYVGIRGSVSEKRLIVSPTDVGYVDKVVCVYPKENEITENIPRMLEKGWSIATYGPTGISWIQSWCVDCRKSYWDGGASLTKPAVWPF